MERGNRRCARIHCRAVVQGDREAAYYRALLLIVAVGLWALLFAVFAGISGCGRAAGDAWMQQAPAMYGQIDHGSAVQSGGAVVWGSDAAARFRHVRFIPVLVQASEVRHSLIFPASPDLTPVPGGGIRAGGLAYDARPL